MERASLLADDVWGAAVRIFAGPGSCPTDAGVVSKDGGEIPEPGGIWFPVYERKYHSIADDESLTKTISALVPDLRWLPDEMVSLKLKFENKRLQPEENLSIELTNGDSIDFVENGNADLSIVAGCFSVSALLNGSRAVSDWIEVDGLENASVVGVSVIPRKYLSEEAINFRDFVGDMSIIEWRNGQTYWSESISDLVKFVNGVETDVVKHVPTISDQPIKSPILMKRKTNGIIDYYRTLGGRSSRRYLSAIQQCRRCI